MPNLPQTAFSRNFLFFLFFRANFEGGVWCCFRFWCIFCVFCGMVHCCIVEKSKIWAFSWLLLGFWFLVEENIVFGVKNAFTGLFCGFCSEGGFVLLFLLGCKFSFACFLIDIKTRCVHERVWLWLPMGNFFLFLGGSRFFLLFSAKLLFRFF